MRKLHITSFLLVLACLCTAQNPFTDKTELFGQNKFASGLVMGIADMNGDGLDDLVRLDKGRRLFIDYQLSDQPTFFQQYIGTPHDFSLWSITLGDIDNNGFPDIVVGGNATGITVWMMNADGTVLSETSLPGADFYVQGTNLVDINQDGWLDLFICNDDGQNRIYANDGTGNLIMNNSWIDFSQETELLASGNYGSIWTDINNDGFIDLYISKCKGGVLDPTDPRRVNQLYLNNGDGTFSEKAEECFMALGAQSWVTDFGDIDNDGDMDAFVANHDRASQLMINNDGYFSDYTDSMGVVLTGLIIQSHLQDFDNDGLLDIIVAGTSPYIYKNMGNYRFEALNAINSLNTITSYALGDLNQDGFIDVYGSHAKDFVQPNIHNDVFWENSPNGNHYINISVQGVQDNFNGIGARLFLYGAWGVQVRDVKTGEGYGITNSLVAHFGLADHSEVDSLKIIWPNGSMDIHHNLVADQTYKAVQGICTSTPSSLTIEGNRILCTGDSTKLIWQSSTSPMWSNGSTDSFIVVKSSGIYFAQTVDSAGCPSFSTNVAIELNPEQEAKILLDKDSILCAGESIFLSLPSFDVVNWNTGSIYNQIEVFDEGNYFGIAQGHCQEWPSDTIHIRFLNAETPEVNWTDRIDQPKKVVFSGAGDSLQWYTNELNLEPDFIGPEWEIKVDSSVTFYVENIEKFIGATASIGEREPIGDNLYNNNNFNGQMIFDVYDDLTLVSVDVYTDDPGERTINLKSGNSDTQTKTINLDTGKTTVVLNFDLVPGINYRLSTDQEKNEMVLGTKSPKLYRTSSQNPLPYPYGSIGFIELKQNNFSSDNYYYFYNWQIKKDDLYCSSERIPLEVTVDATTSSFQLDDEEIVVYPNPFSNKIQIISQNDFKIDFIEIVELSGRVQLEISGEQADHLQADLSQLIPGIYILKLYNSQQVVTKKILKQ